MTVEVLFILASYGNSYYTCGSKAFVNYMKFYLFKKMVVLVKSE